MNITLNYKEVELDIEYSYEPGQKQYFNCREGYGDPGIPAGVEEISAIKFEGRDVLKQFEKQLPKIIAEIEDKLDYEKNN